MSLFVNGALDSSPIAIPPPKKPTLEEVASRTQGHLKRSASTASLTLPTPKTERRRQRVRGPTPEPSDAEEEEDDGDNSCRTRSGKLDFSDLQGDESSDDDLFYHGEGGIATLKLHPKDSLEESITAPISPPPSRRQRGHRHSRKLMEDDDDNPFLETPAGKVKSHSTADDFPTILDANGEPQFNHYVYKGKRVTFLNPLFNQPLTRREKLPITHPDYTPPRHFKPLNLFPKEIYGRAAREKASSDIEEDDNPFLESTQRASAKVSL